jgi:hypothetical protein
MTEQSSIGARGFISYARKDNEDFADVVDKLKQQLEGRFHAATGRKLTIFLDRESIEWGADWRSSIRGSVQAATFFIPVVTMRYFESSACREELLAFYENASQLGVTQLILPIVLTGAGEISSEDPRDEVKLIESLNYKNIEDAWLDGYDSPSWARALQGMVSALKKGLESAEEALDQRETFSDEDGNKGATTADFSSEGADVIALGEAFEEATKLTQEALASINAFGESADANMGGVDLSTMPAAQQQVVLTRVANGLRQPAESLASKGAALEKRVTAIDAQLRAVIEEMRTIDAVMAEEQLQSLTSALSGSDDLTGALNQMNQIVQVLRFAAMTNVSLRRAVQPAIQGIQSIATAMSTFESWKTV